MILCYTPAVDAASKQCPVSRNRKPSTSLSTHAGRGRFAFTLIELLTVIAVIAILAAISFAIVGRVMTYANMAESNSNMHNLYVAISSYTNDHGGRLPNNTKQGSPTWDIEILPYLSVPPEAIEGIRANPVKGAYDGYLSIFTTRADDIERASPELFPRSYSMRAWTNNHNFGSATEPVTTFPGQPNRGSLLSLVDSPAQASLMVEVFRPRNTIGVGLYHLQAMPSEHGQTPESSDWMHGGTSLVLFLDGHIEQITGEDVQPVIQGPYWPVRD